MSHSQADTQRDNWNTVDYHLEALSLAQRRPRISEHIRQTILQILSEDKPQFGLLLVRDMTGCYRDAHAVDVTNDHEISDLAWILRHQWQQPVELDFYLVNELRRRRGLSYLGPEDRKTPHLYTGQGEG